MKEEHTQSIAAEVAVKLLETMGFDASVEVREGLNGTRETFTCAISVPKTDSHLLIGARGASLSAIQYLIQRIVGRKMRDAEIFSVDINQYWKEKQTLLESDASEAMREALATGRPVHMRPMVSYERKIIHTFLAKDERVETESFGSGEERKIIVKPASIV